MASPYTTDNIYEGQRRTGDSDLNSGLRPPVGGESGFASSANNGPGYDRAADDTDGTTAPGPGFNASATGKTAGTTGDLADSYGTRAGADDYVGTNVPGAAPAPNANAITGSGKGSQAQASDGPGGKQGPSVGDKILGAAEKLAGSVTKNEALKEKGTQRQQGGL
ncbi:hypothetical protein HMN09_01002000 [Mycena chlorophos]|uniref:Uncharacterized protein n=1 Tax=Mycena chlorophos TaxID=658473 RepID=A0A8H6W339_MYCCL|nr:hypothetical protein HMN09_01002000 [Mycena chlorophos]